MPDQSAVIFGLSGLTLTEQERVFFQETTPLGYILFARNIDTPDQLKALTASIRTMSGNPDTPILIDQEGGRVQRLGSPHWREAPSAESFGTLWDSSPENALRAVKLNTALIADELNQVGIDVNCAPLLDVPIPEVTKAIGNRAFHKDPAVIIELARVQADTYLENGILPVIKHIPGHGRATCDSHLDLPTVSDPDAVLEISDFVPFKALNTYPLGMTAHIVFDAYDKEHPATISSVVIDYVIRQKIGFDGLLMTDDLSMKALKQPFADRAKNSLDAGCDIVLHCNGDMAEMTEVALGLSKMTPVANKRWANALKTRKTPGLIDTQAVMAELQSLLS